MHKKYLKPMASFAVLMLIILGISCVWTTFYTARRRYTKYSLSSRKSVLFGSQWRDSVRLPADLLKTINESIPAVVPEINSVYTIGHFGSAQGVFTYRGFDSKCLILYKDEFYLHIIDIN